MTTGVIIANMSLTTPTSPTHFLVASFPWVEACLASCLEVHHLKHARHKWQQQQQQGQQQQGQQQWQRKLGGSSKATTDTASSCLVRLSHAVDRTTLSTDSTRCKQPALAWWHHAHRWRHPRPHAWRHAHSWRTCRCKQQQQQQHQYACCPVASNSKGTRTRLIQQARG
jgi:hypothetical protein